MKNHRIDFHGLGEIDKKTNELQARHFCGQRFGNICPMHRNAKRSKSGRSREPKLDNARRLRGVYFIDLDDEEFEDIVKNARRKLEIPMPAAMPCKTSLCRSSKETCRATGGHKTKFACIVKLTNL